MKHTKCLSVTSQCLLVAFLFLGSLVSSAEAVIKLADGFNAALGKPVSANITCGTPLESYYNTRQGSVVPRSRVMSFCDASNPALARPASYITDGNLTTSWQSTNNVDKAYITINMNQPFYGKQLLFTFGDYRRPGQIAIYKSSDFGKTYQPWHYMVTAREDCTYVFGIPEKDIFEKPDAKVNRVLCQVYTGYPYEYGEQVLIELNGEQRGVGSSYYDSQDLLKWMNVTNVHIRFSGLYRKFDYMDTRWHHYDLSDITLVGRCDCSGHGDGFNCPLDQKTGQRSCTCADNTCGPTCNQCCPAFNQYPWKHGMKHSWEPDPTNKCEACNCNQHSSECYYDPMVAAQGKSLNSQGVFSGGGVCLNCQHNTAGINCESCAKFYYRQAAVLSTDINACAACGCTEAGSLAYPPQIAFRQCISDLNMARSYPGKTIGDCFCKQNVQGGKCDQCKDTFYRLEISNQLGCRDCGCYLAGTVDRSNLCLKNFFGQCPCKSNVKARDCSVCKDGYYNLLDGYKDGCKWCDCDIGASISPYVCNKVTGVCTCRAHILSKRCKEVEDRYYYPQPHYICGTRSIYSPASSGLVSTIEIPHDATYRLVLNYQFVGAGSTTLLLYLRQQNNPDLLYKDNLPAAIPSTCDDGEPCHNIFRSGATTDYYLPRGTYDLEVKSSFDLKGLTLERVCAVPLEFINADILLAPQKQPFLDTCDVLNNNMQIGTSNETMCLAAVYSMTVKFEDGALPCNCHPLGSVNQTCNKYGGVCHCKQGVTGRDCSMCKPGFWKFSQDGCVPCECKGSDPVCEPKTGMCNCPANTQGRVCDTCMCNNNSNECNRDGTCVNCQKNTAGKHCGECKIHHYGNALNGTCTPCNCHQSGAFNASCNMLSGQCFCRENVVGKECNKCRTNYFGLGVNGCKPCNCNSEGSYDLQCGNTGQCNCYEQAQNLKCDKCKNGWFGLPLYKCQACACNTTGSTFGSDCSNDQHGQCLCKYGVAGRACDKCQKQFAGFSNTGCKECPLCTRKLQKQVDSVELNLMDVVNGMNLTRNLTNLKVSLEKSQAKVEREQENAVHFDVRVKKGQNDYEYLRTQRLAPYNQRHMDLLTRINEVTTQATGMESMSTGSLNYMTSILYEAMNAYNSSQIASKVSSDTFASLVNMNILASKIVKNAFEYIQDVPTFTFEIDQEKVDADLKLSNMLFGNVTKTGQYVNRQYEVTDAFKRVVDDSGRYFREKEEDWGSTNPQFLLDVQNIYYKGQAVQEMLNNTQNLLVMQSQFITSTMEHQLSVQNNLNKGQEAYNGASAFYEQMKLQTEPVTGGIVVQFFTYNPQNSILRLNVLRGYHLVARDFPQQLSDPYFELSIYPMVHNQGPLKSKVVSNTLNPTWQLPEGGTYQYFLTGSDLKFTKLRIRLYDSDTGNTDDFMGEVEIDLSKIYTRIQTESFQETYSLQPMGYNARWGGNFEAGSNGLVDLQRMLTTQISQVNAILTQTESVYNKAQANANYLNQQAQLLSSNFEQAKRYASSAVNAVNTYNEINSLLNQSLNAAIAANTSVNMIMTMINTISTNTMNARASQELLKAQEFQKLSLNRNVQYSALNLHIRSETFGSVGVLNPPRSFVKINGYDHSRNVNGHNIVIVDLVTGVVDQSVVFRTDVDSSAGQRMAEVLRNIPKGKLIIIIKQGEGTISTQHQPELISQLLVFGGQAPFFTNHRGSYILIGTRKEAGKTYPWIEQVVKAESTGESEIVKTIYSDITLMQLLTAANGTFYSALPHWKSINDLYPVLQQRTAELLTNAVNAPITRAALEAANVVISQAVDSSTKVLKDTQKLLINVNELQLKYDYVLSVSGNATSMLSNATKTAQAAESKLTSQTANVAKAIKIEQEFQKTNANMNAKLLALDSMVKRVMDLAATFPFTVMFHKYAYSVYAPQSQCVDVVILFRYNSMQFDFKANTSNGGLIAVQPNPPSMDSLITITMVNNYLQLNMMLGSGTVSQGRNSLLIQMGRWYRVYVSRIGRDALFTVQDDTGYFVSTKLVSTPTAPELVGYSCKTRIFLNGFPTNAADNGASKEFDKNNVFYGSYDNLVIDDQMYNLWQPVNMEGLREYTPHRFMPERPPDSTTASFYGNGFIKQGTDRLVVSSQHAIVEMEFRTFQDNAIIFAVTGADSSIVYGLYIKDGKLVFRYASTQGNDVMLMTTRTNFNSGEWYKVRVSRDRANCSMIVHPVPLRGDFDIEMKQLYIDPGVTIKVGIFIMFGTANKESPVPPPVKGVFAGDMRNVHMSNSLESRLIPRSLNSTQNIEVKGVTFYRMIKGTIIQAIRFYGYMAWMPDHYGSYATVDSFQTSPINNLYISFKTEQFVGMLFYKESTSTDLNLYVSMMGGNLFILLQNNNFNNAAPFVSSNLTLSDGRWHNVSLDYTNNGYQLQIDSKIVYTGWFGAGYSGRIGTGILYVGGAPTSMDIKLPIPTRRSLEMDVQTFAVNTQNQMFFANNQKTVGVSYAGTKPGLHAPLPPPSCAAALPQLTYAPDPLQVRFGVIPWVGSQSYIAYDLEPAIRKFFTSSFVITMSFRATVEDGIIFYMADHVSNPTQYVSLELIAGKLRYQFKTGTGKISISTDAKYAGDGKWYKVYLLRIYQFGAMLLPDTREYHNEKHVYQAMDMTMRTPLYIGGLPSHVNAPSFQNRKFGYNGCLRKFEISSAFETHALDFSKPDLGGMVTGTSSCYANVDSGIHFNGSAYVYYDNKYTLENNFEVEFQFRTHKRSGVIFYLFTNQTRQGVSSSSAYGAFALLELDEGKLHFYYKPMLVQTAEKVSWVDAQMNVSHYSCDQKWHTVKITKQGNLLHLHLDQFSVSSYVFTQGTIAGNMYVGGVPDGITKPGRVNPFQGCLRMTNMNANAKNSNEVHTSLGGKNIVFGCPGN